jgi:hypothetical protein
MTLTSILARRPATSIDDVVSMLSDIAASLPDGDGLKWFNRLYLEVTVAVDRGVAGGTVFQDAAFIRSLDVVFANLYFDAAAADAERPGSAPAAWRPLFLARERPGLTRLQCALAGMNAHINRDLPEAVVRCYKRLGGEPTTGDARYGDYQRVNGILESVEAQVKPEFAVGLLAAIDAVAAPMDDVAAMWSIRTARDAAWTHAQVLWALDAKPPLREAFFASLDRFTGFAGRGLLVPVARVHNPSPVEP